MVRGAEVREAARVLGQRLLARRYGAGRGVIARQPGNAGAMAGATKPISPPPVREWRHDYLPAYVANGMLGLRVGHIPPLYGVAMISGFEGLDPLTGVEAFARAPYPLSGDVQIGASKLSDPRRAMLREQRYDFSCGELHTSLGLDAGEVRADIDVVTLC